MNDKDRLKLMNSLTESHCIFYKGAISYELRAISISLTPLLLGHIDVLDTSVSHLRILRIHPLDSLLAGS